MNWGVKSTEPTRIEIQPPRLKNSVNFHDLWEFRELLFFLLWREVQGRYRQMAFGPLWIILQPIITVAIFSMVFGGLAQLPSEGIPYPIFVYAALLPWMLFSNSMRNAAQSLVSQQNLITKVFFPRLIIPVSAMLSALVDFLASFLVLALILLFCRIFPGWQIMMLPLLTLFVVVLALGIGLWLACLAVKFHDVSIALGFAATVWQYLTPVAYSASLIPGKWQLLYRLNPMVSLIDCFRWALLGTAFPPAWSVIISCVLSLALLISGVFYFCRTEQTIADEL